MVFLLKKAVFTDIDGTLLKGFITIDFVEYLFQNNLFDKSAYVKQKELMLAYKTGKIEFVPWLKEWAGIWALGLKGKKQKDILLAAKIFFPSFEDKIYPSSMKLVKKCHEKGYLVIGVSVGAIEAIDLVKDYLGLDYTFASQLLLNNGVYEDKVVTSMHTEEGKLKAILDFSVEMDIDLKSSIGMGDTPHDLQMLDLMGKKVALNPNEDLLDVAKKENFLVATYGDIIEKIDFLL